MNENQARLLILGCTRAKRHDPAPLPAVERYDGPAFRVVRRYLSMRPDDPPDTYVLSAEHGLIPGGYLIEDYDQPLTAPQVKVLRPGIQAELARLLDGHPYHAVFVHAASTYQHLIQGMPDVPGAGPTLTVASGRPGKKLAMLHDWLHGRPPASDMLANPPSRVLRIRGIVVTQTPDQVRAVARRALANREEKHQRVTSWYVSVDGIQVAPKWLVTQLTGLTPGAFRTGDARRLLSQLGIEVRRA